MSPQNGRRGNCAKYIHPVDQVGISRNSRQYTAYIPVQAHLYVHSNWISCMYVFGAVPSSSILRAHLYTTPSSMIQLMYELSLLIFWIIAVWISQIKSPNQRGYKSCKFLWIRLASFPLCMVLLLFGRIHSCRIE